MNYKNLTASYKDQMLKTLKEFVAINSEYDETTVSKENPFGKGVSKALNYIADVARKDGFEVTVYNNMIVEIIAGKGDKNITILAHADVVPAGSGWDQDPFEVVNKDGVLFARGVADDKGPLLSCYYGLKALKDNNLLGDYQVRFLVGGNEESGSRGVEYYFNDLKKPQPTFGFSPDSAYPLTYGEKGMYNYEVKSNFECKGLISLKGGVAFNAVIEKAEAYLMNDESIKKALANYKDLEVTDLGDVIKVVAYGKAAHGSTPWDGDNAGIKLVTILGEVLNCKEFKEISKLYTDTMGRGINAYYENEEMGVNSMCVGIISYENNSFYMTVNFRYINNIDVKKMIKDINESNKNFEVNVLSESKLLYYPIDSVLVSTLLKVYQEETGDYETKPLTSGGGTYAKEADNVIAFGMEYPGWDAHMHSPNESIKVEHLVDSMGIFARAIVELGKKL